MLARWLTPLTATVVLATSSFAARAHADSCELVEAEHATWATKLLRSGAIVAKFCEACGDKVPGAPTTVTSVAAKAVKDKKSVAINGKVVDLASTYLQTGKATWANVGMLVGCPVTGATAIYTKQAERGPQNGPTGIVECDAYFAAFDQLSACKAFPASAIDAMRDAIKQVRKSIKDAPIEARAGMAQGCKAGYDALKEASKSLGCAIQ
ncbi:MAG: hypothetical protein NT062_34130 [Proteobacteria bacterium]|nr:hypothetical protein [Pseudomonadota bacterium]